MGYDLIFIAYLLFQLKIVVHIIFKAAKFLHPTILNKSYLYTLNIQISTHTHLHTPTHHISHVCCTYTPSAIIIEPPLSFISTHTAFLILIFQSLIFIYILKNLNEENHQ